MKEKDILSFSCIELVSLFEREFPTIMQGANLSKDWKEFEQFLRGYVRLALAKHSDFFVYKTIFQDVHERDPVYSGFFHGGEDSL